LVVEVVRPGAGAAEDGDRRPDVGQRLEPLHKLRHDAEDPPTVLPVDFQLAGALCHTTVPRPFESRFTAETQSTRINRFLFSAFSASCLSMTTKNRSTSR